MGVVFSHSGALLEITINPFSKGIPTLFLRYSFKCFTLPVQIPDSKQQLLTAILVAVKEFIRRAENGSPEIRGIRDSR